ncbi:MAG: hypothetical protein ACLSA6_18990 [Holdemania massiliensis]
MKMRRLSEKMPKMFWKMFWRNYLVFILIATLLLSAFSTWLFYETVQQEKNKAVQITSGLAQTVDQWLSTSSECLQA